MSAELSPAACRALRLVAGIGTLLMAAFIGAALGTGDIAREGAWLLANPWGRVSLVDLYVGFALAGVLIASREPARRAIPWILAVLLLGNLATSLYVLLALRGATRETGRRAPA